MTKLPLVDQRFQNTKECLKVSHEHLPMLDDFVLVIVLSFESAASPKPCALCNQYLPILFWPGFACDRHGIFLNVQINSFSTRRSSRGTLGCLVNPELSSLPAEHW